MNSGGEIRFDPSKVRDTNSDGKIDGDDEINGALTNERGVAVDPSTVSGDTLVSIGGSSDKFKWKEIRKAMDEVVQQHETPSPGSNNPPTEAEIRTALSSKTPSGDPLPEMEETLATVNGLKQALADAEAEQKTAAPAQKNAADTAVRTATTNLRQAQQQLRQQLIEATKKGISEDKLKDFRSAVGDAPRSASSNGNGSGTLRASIAGPQVLAQQAPQGGGGGAGGAAGGGSPASGDPFGGMNAPPISPGYAQAILGDQNADGLGTVLNSQREGQRLMMLFLYYARMAASGDLGAMYQLTQFLSYVISKDKARQNIQISAKLIQLQDQSRKATDTLLSSDSKDEAGFAKALQKAKGEEGTIATSQKLLADMMQEFSHVVEAMTNTSKGMLDAWGRVLRTITRA